MKGYMYIILCKNNKYYTGSTGDLEKRFQEHLRGEGANYTRKHGVKSLAYFEEHSSLEGAFKREKQIQNWSHKKKEALINGNIPGLKQLSMCKNSSHSDNFIISPKESSSLKE
jgi:putative endonuclease